MGQFSDYFCVQPFNYMEMYGCGTALCCPAWLTHDIGGEWESPIELFNSDAAQEVRESMHDGSFRYCTDCPYILGDEVAPGNGTLMRRDEVHQPWLKKIMKKGLTYIDPYSVPVRGLAGYDRTCNLRCPSCRTERINIIKDPPRFKQVMDYQDMLLRDTYPVLKKLRIAGDGDSFASPVYMDLLRRLTREDYPDLTIDINTNGLLFNRKNWAQIGMRDSLGDAIVSVDAATQETYEKIRGGNWNVLVRNLEFMAELKQNGSLGGLWLNFVVQKSNWREMKKFVKMATRLKASGISFIGIRHWNFMSQEYYDENAVWRPEHPEYAEFSASLYDPIFSRKKEPWVSMGTDVWKA